MSAVPFIVELILAFFIVLYYIHKYGNLKHQNIFITIATFIAWYFSFTIIFLLPLDVSSTTYRQCLYDNQTQTIPNKTLSCKIPFGFMTNQTFIIIWRIIYWSSQALTWLILPFMQSYAQSGEFTIKGKIQRAFIANAIYYGIYLAILSILLIYIAVKQKIDGSQLKVIAITASNTWGLFLLILLLGFGLIDFPRTMWLKSDYNLHLKQSYFQLARLHIEKCEAEEELEDLVAEIKQLAEKIKYNHSYRIFIDTIIQKCPEEYNLRLNLEDYHDYNGTTDDLPSEAYFVKLHVKLIKCIHKYKRTNGEWEVQLDELYKLEDIESTVSSTANNYRIVKSPNWHFNFVETFLNHHFPIIIWFYYCIFKKYFFKISSALLAALTVTIIWSEMTFFNKKPVLSIYANLLNINRVYYNYLTIQFLCCMIIAYLCICAYRTIFKIKLFNYYALSANHNSSENSLIFSGTLVCRLTSPLCYNVLCLIHLDSHITKDTNIVETSFTSIMGHMDLVSFINNGFVLYFPILIVFLCLSHLFKWGERVLHFLGFQQFIMDTELTQELIEDGKNLVKRERRQIERNAAEVVGNVENGGGYSRRKELATKLRENYSTKSLLSASSSTTYLSNSNNEISSAVGKTAAKDNEISYEEFNRITKSLINLNFEARSGNKKTIFDNI
jgi:hypothetical protein